MSQAEVRHFDPVLPPKAIADLRAQLEASLSTPLPDVPFEGTKDRFGLTRERFEHLRNAWIDFLQEPDAAGHEDDTWTAFQSYLKTFHHHAVQIEDVDIHFVREKPDAAAEVSGRPIIPLLLLHGWPGSFAEFLKVIKPLAHPGASAPLHIPAFDVIVPSHPGYVFSSYFNAHQSKISGKVRGDHSGPDGDLLVKDVARLMDKLMCKLGFEAGGYAVQGGDWGSWIAREMGVRYPKRVKAVHLNLCPAPPPLLKPLLPVRLGLQLLAPKSVSNALLGLSRQLPSSFYTNPPPFGVIGRTLHTAAHWTIGLPAALSPKERKGLERGTEFAATGRSYAMMQGTRPGTLGLVLSSSPLALMAWVAEKFYAWTDRDPDDHELLASLTLWWCTQTMPRSLYPYRNRPPAGLTYVVSQPENYLRVPTGYTDNAFEIQPTPKAWVAATCNLKWHRAHNSGGHFYSMEKPARFVGDVQDCFGKLWKA